MTRRVLALLAAAVATGTATGCGISHGTSSSRGIIAQSTFDDATPGTVFSGHQCADNVISKPPRYRGLLSYATPRFGAGQGTRSAEITLQAPTPSGFLLAACNFTGTHQANVNNAWTYQGVMIYVPRGTPQVTLPTGVEFYELHFQNIWGAPVSLQFHHDSVVAGLELGACNGGATSVVPTNDPGCAYRSNLTCNKGRWTCIPTQYVIPPGKFTEGKWYEIVMAVKWSSTSGRIESFYKAKDSSTWTAEVNLSGIPTMQWVAGRACCAARYIDELEAYTFALHGTAPLHIYLDDAVNATSVRAAEGAMP